jgi:hypothetical protein
MPRPLPFATNAVRKGRTQPSPATISRNHLPQPSPATISRNHLPRVAIWRFHVSPDQPLANPRSGRCRIRSGRCKAKHGGLKRVRYPGKTVWRPENLPRCRTIQGDEAAWKPIRARWRDHFRPFQTISGHFRTHSNSPRLFFLFDRQLSLYSRIELSGRNESASVQCALNHGLVYGVNYGLNHGHDQKHDRGHDCYDAGS